MWEPQSALSCNHGSGTNPKVWQVNWRDFGENQWVIWNWPISIDPVYHVFYCIYIVDLFVHCVFTSFITVKFIINLHVCVCLYAYIDRHREIYMLPQHRGAHTHTNRLTFTCHRGSAHHSLQTQGDTPQPVCSMQQVHITWPVWAWAQGGCLCPGCCKAQQAGTG